MHFMCMNEWMLNLDVYCKYMDVCICVCESCWCGSHLCGKYSNSNTCNLILLSYEHNDQTDE